MAKWTTMAMAGTLLSGLVLPNAWAGPIPTPSLGPVHTRLAGVQVAAATNATTGVPDKNASAVSPDKSPDAEKVAVPEVPPTGHETGAENNEAPSSKSSAAASGPIDAPGTEPSRHQASAPGAADPVHLGKSDKHFASTALAAGTAEVDEARLALAQSENADVKSFAQMMIDDHTKAGDHLKTIAKVEPSAKLGTAEHAKLEKLRAAKGAAFDKAYVKNQLHAHDQAVALFKREAASGRDPQLRRFASDTLPTLETHRKLVKELSTKL